jgi:uncharacterized protein with PIN domain
MANTGRCPKCSKVIGNVLIEEVGIVMDSSPKFSGVSYRCPHCDFVISVGADPVALRESILEGLREIVRK